MFGRWEVIARRATVAARCAWGGLMDDVLEAYTTGRVDAFSGRRDPARAEHPVTGADYRVGFLDGRIDVFKLHAGVRRILNQTD
jgi:hypothetical protein